MGKQIVDAALTVHRALGPGLLESVYEGALAHELTIRGLGVRRQVPMSVRYKGVEFEEGFRADLVVEDKVIVEIKSVETFHNAHKKQVLTYLKLSGRKLGFLINFGEELLKNGIVRIVNGLQEN